MNEVVIRVVKIVLMLFFYIVFMDVIVDMFMGLVKVSTKFILKQHWFVKIRGKL